MAEINISMINSLSGVSGVAQSGKTSQAESGSDFASTLSNALEKYRELNTESDVATLDLLTGNTDNLSDMIIATKKAEIALNLTVQIRNKAMEAYKEIMNMQV
ncbi:MAG TPA: flagellar hook-basal body complex protein FliE [Clostridiales bacterium]|nr:flagellar hook-basal body complex protein FliE [Clostridiales bacterium]